MEESHVLSMLDEIYILNGKFTEKALNLPAEHLVRLKCPPLAASSSLRHSEGSVLEPHSTS